jgi:MFS superfamily sulfate permease-like transporter
MVSSSFRPKLLDTLKSYSRREFTADLIAGVTVGIVALPLAMAFAIAPGVKPEAGIFTAVIAGFLISTLIESCETARKAGTDSAPWTNYPKPCYC